MLNSYTLIPTHKVERLLKWREELYDKGATEQGELGQEKPETLQEIEFLNHVFEILGLGE